MKVPNFYIPESSYQVLIKTGNWSINDIPLDLAAQIKSHFGVSSSFALFSSGIAPEAAAQNPAAIIGGMDWVRKEDKPKPGESELNVYHYFIASKVKDGYPVYDCGHSGVLTPSGWATLGDLNVYLHKKD